MKIVSIGAGNLASHLSKALQKAGFDIVQVYSRTETSARELAECLQTSYSTSIENIVDNASLFIISVSDDAIESIVEKMPSTEGLVLHTAGSVSIDVFSGKFKNYGILYPLQTFSKFRPVDFSEIPVFLEANTRNNLQTIRTIAEAISSKVYEASSSERMKLHLAAVFGCNFVNYLFHLSSEITKQAGYDFNVLSPLILETVRKALTSENPKKVQTGPAFRNDRKVIQKHIDLLISCPEWQELYAIMSERILKMKNEL